MRRGSSAVETINVRIGYWILNNQATGESEYALRFPQPTDRWTVASVRDATKLVCQPYT
jgi:hypothetical protein